MIVFLMYLTAFIKTSVKMFACSMCKIPIKDTSPARYLPIILTKQPNLEDYHYVVTAPIFTRDLPKDIRNALTTSFTLEELVKSFQNLEERSKKRSGIISPLLEVKELLREKELYEKKEED